MTCLIHITDLHEVSDINSAFHVDAAKTVSPLAFKFSETAGTLRAIVDSNQHPTICPAQMSTALA
jgi:hypothetical protein